jgi:diguanylate cyclase (GGDEF)-like protein
MSEQDAQLIFLAVAWQQLLYGAAWGLAAALLPVLRRSALHWLLFCLLSAAALAMMIARPWLPGWLGIGVADCLLVAAMIAVRRASETFFGLDPLDREHLAVATVWGLTLALVGVESAGNPVRVPLLTLLLALMILRTIGRVHGPMRAEFGARLAWAIHLPALLTCVASLARSIWVLNQPVEQMNIDGQLHHSPWIGLGMLLALAGVHFAFAGMQLTRMSRALVHLSRHDSLTGLLNRRAALDWLQIEWQRWRRQGEPLHLLMLDLDHFKRVNDQHGHAAGDAALVRVAEVLRATVRGTDLAARIGGEELMVALPGTSAEAAALVAERLRVGIAGQVLWSASGAVDLSVSIGVAAAVWDDASLSQWMERADAALYRAKQAGRNRVVFADRVD